MPMDEDLNPIDIPPQEEKQALRTEQELSPVQPVPVTRKKNGIGAWKMLATVISAAFIVATLFTIWSPISLVSQSLEERMAAALGVEGLPEEAPAIVEATLDPLVANRIGIVVGHQGNDSGAVCPDGLTEVEINSRIATYVQQRLIGLGYEVILLDEFDDRLIDFRGILLISLHADSCEYINDTATGFKVAAALSESKFEDSEKLISCISQRYTEKTGMTFHYQSVTTDMTYYHAFDEINPQTTAAIIETGFMNLDRQMLTDKAELLAEGVVAGLVCYLNNEQLQSPQPTPTNP